MNTEEIYKIAPYVEEHYKRCWVEGYIAGLQAKDPTLDDIAEKYAEKMDISRGWFDGSEIDELIKESYKAGAEWAKEQMLKDGYEYMITNNLAANPIIYYEVRHLGLKYGDKVKIIILKED